jgi:hypothetical protein
LAASCELPKVLGGAGSKASEQGKGHSQSILQALVGI